MYSRINLNLDTRQNEDFFSRASKFQSFRIYRAIVLNLEYLFIVHIQYNNEEKSAWEILKRSESVYMDQNSCSSHHDGLFCC